MYTVNTQRLSLLPCLFVLSIKLTVYTSCVAADNGTRSAPSRAKRSMHSAHAHSALSVTVGVQTRLIRIIKLRVRCNERNIVTGVCWCYGKRVPGTSVRVLVIFFVTKKTTITSI